MRVGAIGVIHIRTMWHANDELARDWLSAPFRIRTAADAVQLLGTSLQHAPIEKLRLAHLEGDGGLIAVTEESGGKDIILFGLAQIIRDACMLGTSRILVAHNHPSGDPTPSRADRYATRRLAETLQLLEIELVDHLIFARGGVASFRGMGLL